ncbi:MAG: preprotein translocase subunit SecG [Deltaproteobacteria bacterium]|nr:preprotein translocase subunit SecG [Deltaproteobacteria bacterium]MBW2359884.1 preprotein translocase subunit SecG [Deltaproteobacteria bacterium]
MTTFLTALHIIACIFLIAVVLLQRGKGAEMGAVFGGGASSTVFGSRGAGNFLTRLTAISAAVFIFTSLSLSYAFTQASQDRLFEGSSADLELDAAAEQAPLFEEVGIAPAASPEAAEAPGAANAETTGGTAQGLIPDLPAPERSDTAE